MWEFQYTVHIPVVKLTIMEWDIQAGDHNSTHFLHCDCHWMLYTENINKMVLEMSTLKILQLFVTRT
jgi:hypothetical protein